MTQVARKQSRARSRVDAKMKARVVSIARWLDGQNTNRAWEVAETNRLNKAHWRKARGADINADIQADLPTIRARCKHEGQNNPHIVAVCKLLSAHVVGKGPILRVTSSSKTFNVKAERLVKNWSAVAGEDGRTLNHHLRGAVRRLPLTGELLWQITNAPAGDKLAVRARVNPLNPKYLQTPTGRDESATMRLGIEFPANSRRPKLYHYREFEDGVSIEEKWREFKAKDIIHWFEQEEEGQVRGVPWIASSLQGAADLRDMSGSVLRAADAAAILAVLLWSQNAEAPAVTLNSNTEIESKSMMALPPGYQATQINPAQPSQNYDSFHRGKVSEQALPVGMPHVVAALDSSDTSYAGGRIDLQNYGTVVGVLQLELETAVLDPLIEVVLQEGKLAGVLGNVPEDVEWSWVWPTIPHVDPVKQADAQQKRINTGTLDVVDACAEYGLDADVVAARRKAYQQQQDADVIDRIAAIQAKIDQAKKSNPALDINWQQILTALGANSAPGAYLAAAAQPVDTSNNRPPADEDEQATGRASPKRKGATRGR